MTGYETSIVFCSNFSIGMGNMEGNANIFVRFLFSNEIYEIGYERRWR